jgi:hypothetical protein
MRDLSLHVLDLVQNSVKAHARLVVVEITADPVRDRLTIVIEDDGDGMSEDLLARVKNPFTTTRTTRKVGLGIPLMEERAALTGGGLTIDSKLGQGTRLETWLGLHHIDRPPLGDLAGTMLSLVLMTPEGPDYVLRVHKPDFDFTFDTREIRQALGDVPLTTPEVVDWMRESLGEGIAPFAQIDREVS